jgi:hypothetical protein
MSVLKLPLLVDVQQKVGELAFHKFFSFNHCSRKYFKLVRRRNVVVVSLTTDTMFVLFTYVYFVWAWEILRRWSACVLTPYGEVRDCRKFDKHVISSKYTY